MSGECASFRLNEPATWADFMKMPDDIKVMYITLLKKKWDVPVSHIGKMMGVSQTQIQRETARLGMVFGKGANKAKWDKDGFYSWVNGVKAADTPVAEETEEEPVEIPVEEPDEETEEIVLKREKFFTFKVDDDATFQGVKRAVPEKGQLEFKCQANLALETVKSLLDNHNVEIRIAWRVIDGDVC